MMEKHSERRRRRRESCVIRLEKWEWGIWGAWRRTWRVCASPPKRRTLHLDRPLPSLSSLRFECETFGKVKEERDKVSKGEEVKKIRENSFRSENEDLF